MVIKVVQCDFCFDDLKEHKSINILIVKNIDTKEPGIKK